MATKLVDLDLLTYYDGKIKDWTEGAYKIVEQAEAEAGYLKTYTLQINGVDASDSVKINIPKDFLIKKGEVKTCTVDDQPIAGLVVGDKYFDFTINTKDTDYRGEVTTMPDASASLLGATYKYTGDTTEDFTKNDYYICVSDGAGGYEWEETSAPPEDTHIYISVKDAFAAYIAGDGITITGQTIAANTGDGLKINSSSKAIEVDTGDGLKINSTSKKVEASVGDGLEIDGTSKAIEAKLGVGLGFNATSKAIDLLEQNATAVDDTNAPTVGGITKADYLAFKGAINSLTPGSETAPTADSGKNETVVTKTHTVAKTTVGDSTPADITLTEYYVTYGAATPTSTSGNYKGEIAVLPTASATNAGNVYKFTGTTGTYTNGKYYKSTESSGSYSWVEDTNAAAGKAGLLSNADKDNINALIGTLGTDVTFASNGDIDALFA